MKRVVSFAFIFLLLASVVNAHFLFETSSSESSELCPRDTELFVNTVTNIEDSTETFTITNRGSASSWATTVPSGFTLLPGESKTIYTYITPNQNAAPGPYNLDVVASGAGSSETKNFDLTVKDCFNSALNSQEGEKSVCPAEVAKFETRLQNTGAYREDFILRVEGPLKDSVSLSDDVVSLAAGESKRIYAYLTAPKESAEYGFTIVVTGASGRSVQSQSYTVNVSPCYNFAVDVAENAYEFCERTRTTVPVEVKNDGTTTNTYSIKVEGPSWAAVERETVTLLAGDTVPVNVILAPDYGVEGNFKVRVSVTPQRGTTRALTELDLNVKKCHGINVELLQNNAKVCNNGAERSFEALVVNTGEVDKRLVLDIQAPSWVTTDLERTFDLAAGEEKQFMIVTNPAQDVDTGKYDINLRLSATDDSSVTVFDNAVFTVEAIDTEECYKPIIETRYNNLVVYFDSNVVLPITIQNAGVEQANYEVVVGGSAASFSKLVPAAVTVAPGRSETVYLYIAPGAQTRLSNYDLQVSVKLKDSNLLETKDLTLRLTDDKGEATPLDTLENEITGAATAGAWQKLRGLVKRLFTPAEPLTEETGEAPEESSEEPVMQEESSEENEVTGEVVEEQQIEDQPIVEGEESGEVLNLEETSVTPESSAETAEEPVEEVTATTTSGFAAVVNAYRYYMLSAIIIVLLVIILVRVEAVNKARTLFGDDDDEDDEE